MFLFASQSFFVLPQSEKKVKTNTLAHSINFWLASFLWRFIRMLISRVFAFCLLYSIVCAVWLCMCVTRARALAVRNRHEIPWRVYALICCCCSCLYLLCSAYFIVATRLILLTATATAATATASMAKHHNRSVTNFEK